VYGTVRTVVWEDGGSNSASYPISIPVPKVSGSDNAYIRNMLSVTIKNRQTRFPFPNVMLNLQNTGLK